MCDTHRIDRRPILTPSYLIQSRCYSLAKTFQFDWGEALLPRNDLPARASSQARRLVSFGTSGRSPRNASISRDRDGCVSASVGNVRFPHWISESPKSLCAIRTPGRTPFPFGAATTGPRTIDVGTTGFFDRIRCRSRRFERGVGDTSFASNAPLDEAELRERCLGNAQLVQRILEQIEPALGPTFAEIDSAISRNDMTRLAAAAHQLKGTAANVGAAPLEAPGLRNGNVGMPRSRIRPIVGVSSVARSVNNRD